MSTSSTRVSYCVIKVSAERDNTLHIDPIKQMNLINYIPQTSTQNFIKSEIQRDTDYLSSPKSENQYPNEDVIVISDFPVKSTLPLCSTSQLYSI